MPAGPTMTTSNPSVLSLIYWIVLSIMILFSNEEWI
jgi:hypothetical protein